MWYEVICKILRGEEVTLRDFNNTDARIIDVLKQEKVSILKHVTPEGVPGYLIPDAKDDFLYIFIPIDVANESLKNLISRR